MSSSLYHLSQSDIYTFLHLYPLLPLPPSPLPSYLSTFPSLRSALSPPPVPVSCPGGTFADVRAREIVRLRRAGEERLRNDAIGKLKSMKAAVDDCMSNVKKHVERLGEGVKIERGVAYDGDVSVAVEVMRLCERVRVSVVGGLDLVNG